MDVGLGGRRGKLSNIEQDPAFLPEQDGPDKIPDKYAGILRSFPLEVPIVDEDGPENKKRYKVMEIN